MKFPVEIDNKIVKPHD